MKPDPGHKNGHWLSSFSPLVFLVPLAPVIAIYVRNVERLTPGMFLFSLVTVFLLFFLFVLICRRFIKSKPSADIFAVSVFIGVLFPPFFKGVWFILWITAFLIFATMSIWRTSLMNPLKYLSYFLVLNLLGQSFLDGGKNLTSLWERDELGKEFQAGFDTVAVPENGEAKRDVYYIVLDRYARADQLKSIYNFDNSGFIDALKGQGLLVAEESYSNYQRTAHSLTSSLNFSYLPTVEGEGSIDWVPLYERLSDSRVVRQFKKMDYQFYNMGSWWEVTRKNKLSDGEFNYRAWPELLRAVFEKSASGKAALGLGVPNLDQRKLQCARVKHKFAELGRQVNQSDPSNPKFVFAHFLVPHPPYVIDRNGDCVSVEEALSRSREQNYVEQVMYANTQILKFFEKVESSSGLKPIVILQADEGPWPKSIVRDEIVRLGGDVTDVEWDEIEQDKLVEKMAILNALYLPGRPHVELPSNSSPVNNFRIVFNEYFSADYPLLENRSYIYPNKQDLYNYYEVTEKLNSN